MFVISKIRVFLKFEYFENNLFHCKFPMYTKFKMEKKQAQRDDKTNSIYN